MSQCSYTHEDTHARERAPTHVPVLPHTHVDTHARGHTPTHMSQCSYTHEDTHARGHAPTHTSQCAYRGMQRTVLRQSPPSLRHLLTHPPYDRPFVRDAQPHAHATAHWVDKQPDVTHSGTG
eukprot:1157934-Pelagomonas_calceolata.AAC.4